MSTLSRRQLLGTVAISPLVADSVPHRTQFDSSLLTETAGPPLIDNQGRQMLALPDGAMLTVFAWGREVRIWRDRLLVAEHTFDAPVTAPQLVPPGELWLSCAGRVLHAADVRTMPTPVCEGTLLAVAGAALAILREDRLILRAGATETIVDDSVSRAALDIDPAGRIHLAYEKRYAIEYRCFGPGGAIAEHVAEPFGSHPTVLVHQGRVLIAWRGDSLSQGTPHTGGPAFDRLGRGGYVALAIRDAGGGWTRHRVADSRQFVKSLYPPDGAWGKGVDRELRVRYEEFTPPSWTLGPDGVPQLFWADTERRWVFGTRLLGRECAPTTEVRGPVEQLTACVAPRAVPASAGTIPIHLVSATRVYLEQIALPSRTVTHGRRIDFLTFDELSSIRGLELRSNTMRRHAANPVLPVDPPGGLADSGVVPDIHRTRNGWRAEVMYMHDARTNPNLWHSDGLAESTDGIHWTKLPPKPLAERYSVDGATTHRLTIRFVEDPREPNPAWRFKGLWRAPRSYVPVVSPDAVTWQTVPVDPHRIVRADDDIRITIDPFDLPQRRFKANAISRSFCGRVAAQWTSADGVHWDGVRETLNFADPFRGPIDPGKTGRILLDSWSGPDDEDEIHGGYVFRDGGRWLLHYMKWSGDGHIQCALASSRDGLNFSRVANGRPTLPLGEPGAWDSGRVALREAPCLVNGIWRQYYVGSGWKHGLGGPGARTFGLYSPCQGGLAEIEAGRWAHLELHREAAAGELITIPLTLTKPHALTLDSEGAGITCAVLDAATGRPLAGFTYAQCDPMENGRAGKVTWRGRSLESLGARNIRLAIRLTGMRVRLFGLNLR